MPHKTIKKICRYAQEKGHRHLSLEKKDGLFVCRYGDNSYLQLDANLEEHIIGVFRSLLNSQEHEFVHNKNFKITDGNKVISGSASIIPGNNGDKLILSLHENKIQVQNLTSSGLNKQQAETIKKALNKKTGLIVINASNANGASSTYYSFLQLIDQNRSIYSLEDFPAHKISSASVIPTKMFSDIRDALSLLSRLDSDVIACDASLSPDELKALWQAAGSKLVIITLPYQSGAKVLQSLKTAGLSTQAITERLLFISTQKLFNKLCLHCRTKLNEDAKIRQFIEKKWPITKKYWPKQSYFNNGCKRCQNKEINNRIAVFEIMSFNQDGSLKKDYKPLILEALKKVESGVISLEEIADWAKYSNHL